jgi:leader peptidase (prepilin peptidase) / N-methyltransferase
MPIEMSPFVALLCVSPFVGSFLGTLAQRLPAGQPVLFARSRCEQCGRQLEAYELIPLVSWTVQRARCAHCRAQLSFFYPAIELAALAVVVWAWTATAGLAFGLSCVLGWLLLALSAMDFLSFRLHDALVGAVALLGIPAIIWLVPSVLWSHALAGALGFALLAALSALYHRLRGREGLGLGDAKLFGAAGLWVGLEGLPSTMLIAAFLALAVAFALFLAGRPVSGETRIPFGPFLALGLWCTWLYGPLVLTWPG